MSGPPTVSLKVHPGREYAMILEQTKTVYDNLLADKYNKLSADILAKKANFDGQATVLAKTDTDKALEYSVKAQDAINKMYKEMFDELTELHKDYQHKLNKMMQTMEEKWRQDHIAQAQKAH
jgi:hypothetical protein